MELAVDPKLAPVASTIVRSKQFQRLRRVLGLAEGISPRLAARLAGALFRRPRRHAQPEREVAWAGTAERLQVAYRAPTGAERKTPKRLALLNWGSGGRRPIVLLMHGWEGRASQMGALAQPLVEAGFRVVGLDAPAHGRSGGKTSSMLEFSAGILSVERELGPLHGLVGHSLGASAAAFAMDEGLPVNRVAFIAPPYDLNIFFDLFAQVLGLRPATQALMLEGYERQFGRPWNSIRCASASPEHAQPLLIAHDIDDPETPFAGGEAVAEAWRNSRLLATEGLGHRRILRDRGVIEAVAAHMNAG